MCKLTSIDLCEDLKKVFLFSIPKNNFFVAEQNGALIISTEKK